MKDSDREPYGRKAQVRFCEGRGEQSPRLLTKTNPVGDMLRAAAIAGALLQASSALAQTKPVVAVFEIKNRHVTVSDVVLSTLREVLSTKLVAAGAYNVVPNE